MKKLILIGIIVALSSDIFAQTIGVAINNNNTDPHPSAILDLTSTDKGILIPRMTEVDKMAISILTDGLMIYQTSGTDPGFYFYDGSAWKPLDGTVNTLDDLTDVSILGSGAFW